MRDLGDISPSNDARLDYSRRITYKTTRPGAGWSSSRVRESDYVCEDRKPVNSGFDIPRETLRCDCLFVRLFAYRDVRTQTQVLISALASGDSLARVSMRFLQLLEESDPRKKEMLCNCSFVYLYRE